MEKRKVFIFANHYKRNYKKILKKVTSKKIQIILLKNSDHRLSNKKDLQTLMSAIDIVRYD